MKPRARRVTIGAAVLVVVLVAVLVVANWGAVRDHVEARHFQLTRETEVILPGHLEPGTMLSEHVSSERLRSYLTHPAVCRQLASCSGFPVIVDRPPIGNAWWPLYEDPDDSARLSNMAEPERMLFLLRSGGYRVLEQRFPRRAYVVIGLPFTYQSTELQGGR